MVEVEESVTTVVGVMVVYNATEIVIQMAAFSSVW